MERDRSGSGGELIVIEYFIRYRSDSISLYTRRRMGTTDLHLFPLSRVIHDSLLLRARGTKGEAVLSRTIGNLSLSLSADLLPRSARPRNGIVAI